MRVFAWELLSLQRLVCSPPPPRQGHVIQGSSAEHPCEDAHIPSGSTKESGVFKNAVKSPRSYKTTTTPTPVRSLRDTMQEQKGQRLSGSGGGFAMTPVPAPHSKRVKWKRGRVARWGARGSTSISISWPRQKPERELEPRMPSQDPCLSGPANQGKFLRIGLTCWKLTLVLPLSPPGGWFSALPCVHRRHPPRCAALPPPGLTLSHDVDGSPESISQVIARSPARPSLLPPHFHPTSFGGEPGTRTTEQDWQCGIIPVTRSLFFFTDDDATRLRAETR